jgi:hypothetical protein
MSAFADFWERNCNEYAVKPRDDRRFQAKIARFAALKTASTIR